MVEGKLSRRNLRVSIAQIMAIALGAVGLIAGNLVRGIYNPVDGTSPVGIAVGMVLGASVALALSIARRALGGTPKEVRELLAWVFLGAIPVGVLAVLVVNGAADRAPSYEARARVASAGPRQTVLRLTESQWAGRTFSQPTRDLARIRHGAMVHAGDEFATRVHPGRLGFAWCESVW